MTLTARRLPQAVVLAIAAALSLFAAPNGSTHVKTTNVIVQGGSNVRDAVVQMGGRVTHDLPIIGGFSAQVPGSAIPAADMLPVGRRASPLFRLVRIVGSGLFHLMFRFEVQGRERIPDQAYVLICNHLGWMDAISLLILLPSEPRIHFLADPTSMMKNRPLWTLVRATGGIVPVDRAQRGNTRLYRHVERCLAEGGVVALFPEGDFGPREGELLPFKKGFAHFAVDASVPVLPVGMAGMKEVWLGKQLFVRIGEPIPPDDRTIEEVHHLGEQAVSALVPRYEEPSGRKPLRGWLTGLF